jgi:hypothetical protein
MSLIVRFLKRDDLISFQKLVKNHYPKKNHIFEKNTKVINFYYNNFNDKKIKILGLFFYKELVAAQGIISLDNWDKKIKKILYLAFTVKSKKYKKDCLIIFLNYIYKLKPLFLATVGTNMLTAGKILDKISKIRNLDHYYIANPFVKNKISHNLIKKKITKFNINKNISLLVSKKILNLPFHNYEPIKTRKYFINKYLKNPFYKYFLMNFYKDKKLLFFFVVRKIFIKSHKAKIIRVVDFYGNFPKNLDFSQLIINYLLKNNIEYLDFMVFGVDKKNLIKIGFNKKYNKNKIPNHFEPFDRNSNFLNYGIFINKLKKNILIFKGDGDQDRPNILIKNKKL